MQFVQALIAAVSQHFKALVQLKLALLIKSEIVCWAATMGGADDLSGRAVNHNLRLQGVPLLLAAVIIFLLFFGRSTGVSATSTTMNSISWSAC